MTQRNGRTTRRRGKRRVCVITGTRAEYGILRSTLHAINDHPKLQLQLVATGLHLIKQFGMTVRRIESDGWTIDARVPMQRGADSALDQAEGLARGVWGIARFLESDQADIVLVLGDRIEAMAGALAATTTGRVLAHIHGGDVAPGHIDDALRHSVTKLAHLHLTASDDAARRVIRMGEDPNAVHVVGAPGLDDVHEIAQHLNGRRRNQAVVLYHAFGRPATTERRVMESILRATSRHDLTPLVIGPNADRGHDGVLDAIAQFQIKSDAEMTVTPSLDRSEYLKSVAESRVLIGNSSSGVIEANILGAPVVNVGNRQAGRLRNGNAVIDSGESYAEISAALERALARGSKRPNPRTPSKYGRGGSGAKIAEILATVQLTDELRTKRIRY
jgi:UDP-N-acetylglucosamine 2-epimerase (non-hydrolysing)/GDP/UDP-N,N'-diacetylbacillosamine 2-epimerase (hydrolysing)